MKIPFSRLLREEVEVDDEFDLVVEADDEHAVLILSQDLFDEAKTGGAFLTRTRRWLPLVPMRRPSVSSRSVSRVK